MKYLRFIYALLIAFIAWCAPASAAFVITAAPTASGSGTNSATSGSSIAITLNGSIPSGAAVVVGIFDFNGTAAGTVADNGSGNTYTAIANIGLNNNIPTNGVLAVYVASNINGLSSGKTITYTPSSGSNTYNLMISVSYVTGAGSVDSAVTATNYGTNISTTINTTVTAAGTPSQSDQYIGLVGFFPGLPGSVPTFTQDSTNASYATPPNGTTSNYVPAQIYTLSINGGSVVSAANLTYAPSYTTVASGGAWAAIIIALKPSSGPSKTCTLTLLGAGPC